MAHPLANILVYTEYADSQRAAVDALAAAHIDGTVLTISGDDPEVARTRAAERCGAEDNIILVSTDSLAEGLNLHQRCFHLIHLDLPYNPNRLEQRNGRIDRYGQRNDPQIRYLYLAGTFEERLLLRLIAKYEKARACLCFMPNTLGVGADPGSLHETLLSGFAEDAPTLFGDAPRLVHSLDLAAEDGNNDAYRDLLREIDRAFQSFDHMAVRHGWMAGGTDTSEAPAGVPRNDIDLAGFVASVLTVTEHGLRVPAEWTPALDQLAGFDRLTGTIRLTGDPNELRDSAGRELMYPGRCHPVTRRAIARARTGPTGQVSAARGQTLSLLMTYAADVSDPSGTLFRQVFALRLYPDGSIQEQPDFLSLSEPARLSQDYAQAGPRPPDRGLPSVPPGGDAAAGIDRIDDAPMAACRTDGARADSLQPPHGLWQDLFVQWAPGRIVAADLLSVAIAERLAAGFERAYRQRAARDVAATKAWLERRTFELCGPVVPSIGDLFDPAPLLVDSPPLAVETAPLLVDADPLAADSAPLVAAWRSCAAAEPRLAGFAADPSVAVPRRRDAADVLSRFRAVCAVQPAWSAPMVRTLGMLMLCP